jgi:hypothetical protein
MIGLMMNVKKSLKQEVELELKWCTGKQYQMWTIIKVEEEKQRGYVLG